uniref:50S ribosomal protein L33, chloroplastic n=1 Tax=Cucumis melo TaxID=3656 RepID=A0A9I9CFI8_CUCME
TLKTIPRILPISSTNSLRLPLPPISCAAFTPSPPEMGDKKKKATMFIRLVSAAGTGFFYVKRKPTKITEKLEFRKYDPRVNRHVLFTEAKMK